MQLCLRVLLHSQCQWRLMTAWIMANPGSDWTWIRGGQFELGWNYKQPRKTWTSKRLGSCGWSLDSRQRCENITPFTVSNADLEPHMLLLTNKFCLKGTSGRIGTNPEWSLDPR
jgi:hypothetical protein